MENWITKKINSLLKNPSLYPHVQGEAEGFAFHDPHPQSINLSKFSDVFTAENKGPYRVKLTVDNKPDILMNCLLYTSPSPRD